MTPILLTLAYLTYCLVSSVAAFILTWWALNSIGAWWHASQTKRARDQFMVRLGRRKGE